MNDRGPGESAERAERRRRMRLIYAALALGAVSGAMIAAVTLGQEAGPDSPLPLWVATLLTILWLGTMAYGAWYYETQVDELERNANYYGYAVGGGLVLVLYPVWYGFWWAGVLPEPQHEALMGLLLVAALAGYSWKKYR